MVTDLSPEPALWGGRFVGRGGGLDGLDGVGQFLSHPRDEGRLRFQHRVRGVESYSAEELAEEIEGFGTHAAA